MDVTLTVNGRRHHVNVESRMTLPDAVRERPGPVGSRKACDLGQYGACTVLLDGKRGLSCFLLAAPVEGEVTTVEGLASETIPLHSMQQAVLESDAYPCG